MQEKAIARLFFIQRLYRRILKLHRYLPADVKKLGDDYVKEEFKRHKGANQLQAFEFVNEWKNYCTTLEDQLTQDGHLIGQNLNENQVDSLSQDQLGQLFELQQETITNKKK